MSEILATLRSLLPEVEIPWVNLVKALVVLILGYLMARLVKRRLKFRSVHPQSVLMVRRTISYGIYVVAVAWALQELGMNLGTLLGAAGVATVAIGFAAQTSVSNLIAGLFLMGERPFVVGDVIKISDSLGEVVSIDLMSVKLRTFDNLLVRIPNESMLKSNVINYTRFPIRRIDVRVGVAYKEDLSKVRTVLMAIADRNPKCFEEPKPLFIFNGYGDSSLDLQFSVWTSLADYFEVRTALHLEIKKAFDEHGIEIPFPHRTLYAGAVTEPFPVRIVADPGDREGLGIGESIVQGSQAAGGDGKLAEPVPKASESGATIG